MILIYPVIALATPYGHTGSKKNLLGDDPSDELVRSLSNETQVTASTPPTFLAHTNEDSGVPAENSLLFVLALRKAKVPVEFHLFEKGQHGLGLGHGARQFGIGPEPGVPGMAQAIAPSGSKGRVSWIARVGIQPSRNPDHDGPSKIKNRPENQYRTTTSPLVVRHQINWPVNGWSGSQGGFPRIQTVSRERASGGSCEASRSPFGGGAALPEAKQPSPVGWSLES